MKVCTKCNRLLGDDELLCPNCEVRESAGGPTTVSASSKAVYRERHEQTADITIGILDAESRRYSMPEVQREPYGEMIPAWEQALGNEENEDTKTIKTSKPSISATQAFTIEIPLGEVLEKLEREKTYRQEYEGKQSAQNALVQNEEPESAVETIEDAAGFPFEKIRPGKSDTSKNDTNAGIIEQELAARERHKSKANNKSLNKLGVSLLAVMIITVLVLSTRIITKLISKPETTDENYYLTRLTGTWSGEPFTFVDDPDDKNTYMEILKINSDATFTLQYLIVNESIPKGYLDGEWDVFEELSGTVKILPDNATLALMYEQGGEQMVFIRDIVELEENRIVLREYSDNEEYYYDMAFKRER